MQWRCRRFSARQGARGLGMRTESRRVPRLRRTASHATASKTASMSCTRIRRPHPADTHRCRSSEHGTSPPASQEMTVRQDLAGQPVQLVFTELVDSGLLGGLCLGDVTRCLTVHLRQASTSFPPCTTRARSCWPRGASSSHDRPRSHPSTRRATPTDCVRPQVHAVCIESAELRAQKWLDDRKVWSLPHTGSRRVSPHASGEGYWGGRGTGRRGRGRAALRCVAVW